MLELLNQLDGFDSRGDVKVIMATNRIESLDPGKNYGTLIDKHLYIEPIFECISHKNYFLAFFEEKKHYLQFFQF